MEKLKKGINWKTETLNILTVIIVSMFVALGLHVFVYKADFAPSGVDGAATMLQYASEKYFGHKINAGIFTFALNFPLLVAAWFILNKRYVVYTIVYTVVISVSLMLFDVLGVSQYDCTVKITDKIAAESNNIILDGMYNSHLVAAIFGGVMQGVTGILLKIGGSSGGADVIGCMIQKKFPHKDVEKIIAYVSYVVVAIAFFVYGNLNSVCLSVIEIFVCEKVTAMVLKSNRSAVKFEIVTDKANAEEIKRIIIFKLRRSATILNGQGAFTENDKEMIVCIVNYRQIPEFLRLVKDVPNTFLYYSDVTGVRGNFPFQISDEDPKDTKLLQSRIEQENFEKENSDTSKICSE